MHKNYPSYSLIQTLKKPLLLQGPVGGFFNYLMKEFIKHGSTPFKINFNGGDDWFIDKELDNILSFTDKFNFFEAYLHSIITYYKIDGIILFGDCRPLHKIAIKYCKRNNIPLFVFEEGYIRPNYITFELGGVNANSILTSAINDHLYDKSFYANYIPNETFEKSKELQKTHFHTMKDLSKNAIIYWIAMNSSKSKYPNYIHHKDNDTLKSLKYWVRSYIQDFKFNRKESYLEKEVIENSELHKKYFLVCLQVYNDSQIRDHSPYKNNKKFIYEVIKSFAKNGDKNDKLIIKQHPLDMPYHDYTNYIKHVSKLFKLENRILLVHNLHLPTLLKNSKGLITINSTTGLSALYHKIPVQVLGKSLYNIEGLCHQNGLDAFWQSNMKVDYELFKKFRCLIIEHTQIPGTFYNSKHYPSVIENSKRSICLEEKDECYWFNKLKSITN
jgi:capsular polysaccharide export protein